MPLRIYFLFIALYTVQAACPDGFQPHGSSCYKASGLEASWAEAQMYCQILGSDLAKIETAGEEAILEGIIASLQGSIDSTYWVAGTDIATEGSWRWMDRGGHSVPISGYSNWPSGTIPSDSRNHNCLVIHYRRSHTYWDDEYCNTLHSFICEITTSLCNHCCGVHWLHNQLVNSADPDETAPAGAVSSGSSLFTDLLIPCPIQH